MRAHTKPTVSSNKFKFGACETILGKYLLITFVFRLKQFLDVEVSIKIKGCWLSEKSIISIVFEIFSIHLS